jgi:predicted DCC family thiol-disulfide oxidoreductase YuxK
MLAFTGQPVLLYDGSCGFCDRAVQFVLSLDKGGSVRFSPLSGEFARGIFDRHRAIQGVDSLVFVQNSLSSGETVAVRSDAVLSVGVYLGGWWRVGAIVFQRVPRFLRDAGYGLFAHHRHRLFGERKSCHIPAVEQRHRFIP